MTRLGPNESEAYDCNFFVATFDTVTCPKQLKLVTNIATTDTSMFLHLHRHF